MKLNSDLKQSYGYLLRLSLLLALCVHLVAFMSKKEFGLHPMEARRINMIPIVDTWMPELPDEPPEMPPPDPGQVIEAGEDDPDAVQTVPRQHELWNRPPHPELPIPEFTRIYEESPEIRIAAKPEYPELALAAGIEGTVYITAYIDTLGHVVKAEVALSAHEILDRAALGAVRKWQFRPAKMRDKPVAVMVEIPIDFKLR